VFAPLYGRSYLPLAESIHELLQCSPGELQGGHGNGFTKPLAIVCMQRRNGDQIDKFLEHFSSLLPPATYHVAHQVEVDQKTGGGEMKPAKIEIYEMYFT